MAPALRREKEYAKKVVLCKINTPSADDKTVISHSSVVIRERSVRSAIGGQAKLYRRVKLITAMIAAEKSTPKHMRNLMLHDLSNFLISWYIW